MSPALPIPLHIYVHGCPCVCPPLISLPWLAGSAVGDDDDDNALLYTQFENPNRVPIYGVVNWFDPPLTPLHTADTTHCPRIHTPKQ